VDVEMTKREMEEQIRKKREQMIEIAKQHGFTNEKTLKSSQELDNLLNKYQRFFRSPKIREYPTASFSINDFPDLPSLSA
jgi:stage 0 sporulation regulatory protein